MAQLATRSLEVGAEGIAGRAGKFWIYLHLNTDGQLCARMTTTGITGDFTIHPVPGDPGEPGRFECRTRGGWAIGPVTTRQMNQARTVIRIRLVEQSSKWALWRGTRPCNFRRLSICPGHGLYCSIKG